MAGKANLSNVGSGRPTRFVRATAIAAVNHIEAVYSRLDLRIRRGRTIHAIDANCRRQDEKECAANDCFSKSSIRAFIKAGIDQYR